MGTSSGRAGARRLQPIPGVKRIAGILAAATLWGCGVGADDPEGLAAAGVVYGADGQRLKAEVTSTTSTGATSVVAPGSPTSAPQDPIPAIDGSRTPVNPLNVIGTSPTLGGYPSLPGK